jgi:uncharacterized protein YrrD
MRLKELLGLPVIDPTAARKIGTVVDYQVDSTAGRLAALDVDDGQGGGGERILTQRIRRVGQNAVMLTGRGGATPGLPPDINERWLDSSTVLGLEIMGDDGNLIGHLTDAAFDQDTLQIEVYLLKASFLQRLFGRRSRIQPSRIHACSRELMIVSTGQVAEVTAPATPDAAVDDTTSVTVRMPLKAEDSVPTPARDKIPEREPVTAPR